MIKRFLNLVISSVIILAGISPVPTFAQMESMVSDPCGDVPDGRACMPATVTEPATGTLIDISSEENVTICGVAEREAKVFVHIFDENGQLYTTGAPITGSANEIGNFCVDVNTIISLPPGRAEAYAWFLASVEDYDEDRTFIQVTSPVGILLNSENLEDLECQNQGTINNQLPRFTDPTFEMDIPELPGAKIVRLGIDLARAGHHFFLSTPPGMDADDVLPQAQDYLFGMVEEEILKLHCNNMPLDSTIEEAVSASCIPLQGQLGRLGIVDTSGLFGVNRTGTPGATGDIAGGACPVVAAGDSLNKNIDDVVAAVTSLKDARGGCFEDDGVTPIGNVDLDFLPLVEGHYVGGWAFVKENSYANMNNDADLTANTCLDGKIVSIRYVSGMSPLIFMTSSYDQDVLVNVKPKKGKVSYSRPKKINNGWLRHVSPDASSAPIYYEFSEALAVDQTRGIFVAQPDLEATITRLLSDAGVSKDRIEALIEMDIRSNLPNSKYITIRLVDDIDRQVPLELSVQPERIYRAVFALEASEEPVEGLVGFKLPKVASYTGGLEVMELGAFMQR